VVPLGRVLIFPKGSPVPDKGSPVRGLIYPKVDVDTLVFLYTYIKMTKYICVHISNYFCVYMNVYRSICLSIYLILT
jgi:hypothetical protein